MKLYNKIINVIVELNEYCVDETPTGWHDFTQTPTSANHIFTYYPKWAWKEVDSNNGEQ